MATTSNYGWTTPDDSSLVKDGASAIRALGTAIDTSMNTALGTKKAGLVLLNTTSFSGVASQALTASTFTSTYQNYKIVIGNLTSTATCNLQVKLRASGTDSSADYNVSGITQPLGTTTVTGTSNLGTTTYWYIGAVQSAFAINSFELDIFRPQETSFTQIMSRGIGTSSGGSFSNFTSLGTHYVSASYDAINLIASTGNISGSLSVYGYNK